ncbi:MAG: type II toxin-antitoxin system PemK/MazF family toxin [Spirochaetes bacterium]|nr:MAG: type II toxin-antitoxin system PemK/MazF family toxin [Spirochaetota bacterium]
MFNRGSIYLAGLHPSKGAEPGKTRPVLVIQTDLLNETEHSTVIVIPLTTNLIDNTYPLRLRISKRGRLSADSDLLCDQIRAIDKRRLIPDKIASLTAEEMIKVEIQVQILLGN